MTTGIGAHNNVRRVNNDFLSNQCTTGYYVDTPAADQTQGTVFDGSAQQAQASSNCEDGQDDGHISLWSKFKNAVKGVGNFFKGMVCDENGNWDTYIDGNRTDTNSFTLTNQRKIGIINYNSNAVKILGIRAV